jgi:hypothetical protein
MKRKWNTNAQFNTTVTLVDGLWPVWIYSHNNKRVCQELGNYLNKCDPSAEIEIWIDFQSRGYYSPASMYGGADRVGWPEEGDDERTVNNVKVNEVLVSIAEKIFAECFDKVEQVEIDRSDDRY